MPAVVAVDKNETPCRRPRRGCPVEQFSATEKGRGDGGESVGDATEHAKPLCGGAPHKTVLEEQVG